MADTGQYEAAERDPVGTTLLAAVLVGSAAFLFLASFARRPALTFALGKCSRRHDSISPSLDTDSQLSVVQRQVRDSELERTPDVTEQDESDPLVVVSTKETADNRFPPVVDMDNQLLLTAVSQSAMDSVVVQDRNSLCLWGTHQQDDFQWTNYSDWNNAELEQSDDDGDGEYFATLSSNYLSRNGVDDCNYFAGDRSSQMEFYVNSLASDTDIDIHQTAMTEETVGDTGNYQRFPLLETILEETAEELELELEQGCEHSSSSSSSSPSSSSGPWGWGWGWLNSDDDSSSVIHMPMKSKPQIAGPQSPSVKLSTCSNYSDEYAELEEVSHGVVNHAFDDQASNCYSSPTTSESEWSERDQEVPKKKRRLHKYVSDCSSSSSSDDVTILAEAFIGDNDVFEEVNDSRSPSVTESLIQFEALEKEIIDTDEVFHSLDDSSLVFETSATSEPFEDAEPSDAVDKEAEMADDETQTPSSTFDFPHTFNHQQDREIDDCVFRNTSLLRTWSSFENLDPHVDPGVPRRRSASDIAAADAGNKREKLACLTKASGPESFFMVMRNSVSGAQGDFAVENDSPNWRMSSEILDAAEDETHWEPDGYLGSEDEESPQHLSSGSSDSDDYAAEVFDHFETDGHFKLKTFNSSSLNSRMRSFRSFDSLHLLDSPSTEDAITSCSVQLGKSLNFIQEKTDESDSLESNRSNSSSERSSPEANQSKVNRNAQRVDRRRLILQRSAEALSEDSGYGDASGLLHSPDQSCPYNDDVVKTTPELAEVCQEGPAVCIELGPTCDSHETGEEEYENNEENPSQEKLSEHVTVHDSLQLNACPLPSHQTAGSNDNEATQTIDMETLAPEMSALLQRRNPKSRPTPLSLQDAEEFLNCNSPLVVEVQSDHVLQSATNTYAPKLSYVTRALETQFPGPGDLREADANAAEGCDAGPTQAEGAKNEIEDIGPGFYGRSNFSPAEEQHERRAGAQRGGFKDPVDCSEFSECLSHISASFVDDVTCISLADSNSNMSVAPLESCKPVEAFEVGKFLDDNFHPLSENILETLEWSQELHELTEETQSADLCLTSTPKSGYQENTTTDKELSLVHTAKCDEQALPEIQAMDEPSTTEAKTLPTPVPSVAESESESEMKPDDSSKKSSNAKKEKQPLFQRFSLSRLSARMSAAFNRSDAKRSSDPASSKKEEAMPDAAGSATKDSSSDEKHQRKSKSKTETAPKSKQKNFFSRRFNRSSSLPPNANRSRDKSPNVEVSDAAKLPANDNAGNENNATGQVVVHKAEADEAITNSGVNETVEAQESETTEAIQVSEDSVSHEMAPKNANGIGSSATLPFSGKPPMPLPRSLGKPPLPPLAKPRMARRSYLVSNSSDRPPEPVVSNASVQHALEHFREAAKQDRQRLAKSVPDFVIMDETTGCAVASQGIDRQVTGGQDAKDSGDDGRSRARQAALSRASCVESAWNATLSRAVQNLSRSNISSVGLLQPQPVHTKSQGLLETSFDDNHETNIDDLIHNLEDFAKSYCSTSYVESSKAENHVTTSGDKKYKSMLNLGATTAVPVNHHNVAVKMDSAPRVPDANRAKSMEFLLDDHNKTVVQPPENELRKTGERQMSEHELRVQRSLQRLNVPEWFKNARQPATSSGPFTRRREQYGSVGLSGSTSRSGWPDIKTASMTSLGSSSRCATPTRVVIPTRVRPPSDWRHVKSSRESLTSPASSLSSTVASPSISCSSPQDSATTQSVFSWSGAATSGASSQFQRWGSGRSSASPAPSYRSSLSTHRQPYLGWRSQEKINSLGIGSTPSLYQSPAERLAQTVRKTTVPEPSHSKADDTDLNIADVRSSISEVTSAIVHYVSENATRSEEPTNTSHELKLERAEPQSRTPSPRRQRCVWMESSFVGSSSGKQEKGTSSAAVNNHCHTGKHLASSEFAPSSRSGEFMLA